MAVKFSCECGKRFSAQEKYAGRRTRCPDCGREMEIPVQAAREADEAQPPMAPILDQVKSTGAHDANVSERQKANSTEGPRSKSPISVIGIVAGALGLVLVGGCITLLMVRNMESTPKHEPVAPSARAAAAVATGGAPRYEIIEQDGDRAKDVFFVRLDRKPSRDELLVISREIRSRGRAPRTVIWFGLVDGNPKSNPWASVDCDPEPQVEIRGLTAQAEAELLRRPLAAGASDIIGRWIEDANGGALYTLYRRADSLLLETAHSPDGNGTQDELVKIEGGGLQQFQRKAFSRAGDRYVINGYGDLEIRDDHGLILVARRVP
jgi:hypothetical protein